MKDRKRYIRVKDRKRKIIQKRDKDKAKKERKKKKKRARKKRQTETRAPGQKYYMTYKCKYIKYQTKKYWKKNTFCITSIVYNM